jgi:hypothetical protein
MKRIVISTTIALMLLGGIAHAQSSGPSGRGATNGDPAASSANPNAAPGITTGSATKPSRSGTSTSGGSDANGDQGRDKAPGSNMNVRPRDQQKPME